MVDVTTLDAYKEKEKTDMVPYLNVARAEEDELEYEWIKIESAYLDDAGVFDDKGNRVEGETVEKLHLDLAYGEALYKWPLNRTNLRTLTRDFGKESDDWVGEFVKVKVHDWPSGARGLVVISREELRKLKVEIPEKDKEDVGGDPSPSSSSSSSSLNEFAFNPELEAGVIVNGIIEDLTADELRVTKKLILEVAESQLKGAKPELRKAVARDVTSRKRIPTE